MVDQPRKNSKKSTSGRTVRFRTQEISEERLAAKIEDLIQKGKDFRKPRTRKKKESVIKFLDDCGRPISKTRTRRRHQIGKRQRNETGNRNLLETCYGKATSAHTTHIKYLINNQLYGHLTVPVRLAIRLIWSTRLEHVL